MKEGGVTPRWRLRSLAAVALVPPLLEIVSLPRLDRWRAALSRNPHSDAPDDGVLAKWVDDALTGLPRPWSRTCLRRAAVLFFLLRRAGRPVDLCIGVRRDESDAVQAHAWLVLDGETYLEPAATLELVARYTLIARFPSSVANRPA